MVLKISSITKRKIAKLTLCDRAWVSAAKVTQVNEKDIPALQLEVGPPAASGQCNSAHATVGMKELSSHFARGINRFTVSAGAESAEVVLDVEK